MSRILELVLALMIFPVVFILMLLCIVIIVLFDRGPIFFTSERLGENKQSFTMVKFRTMSSYAPLVPSSHKDASVYVTTVGRFLRYTSLDELPQIFNILNGSMTFIGPRPCLLSEFKLIELRKNKGIFQIKPGITGLAQVRGRDRNSERNKVRYEAFYNEKKSFLFDLKIIIMTIKAVLNFSNVSH